MPQSPYFVAKNPSNALVPLLVDSAGLLQATVAQTPGLASAPLKVDSSGALLTTQGAGEGNSSKNYTANNAGDLIKTGPGTLRSLDINTAGVTSAAVLYDGTTTGGTKLGTWSTLAQAVLNLDIAFTVGLFIVLTGGTPADVTVEYK